jgi:hypothetical protein
VIGGTERGWAEAAGLKEIGELTGFKNGATETTKEIEKTNIFPFPSLTSLLRF